MKRKRRIRSPHAPSIALCMIVKNEAANLERCLKTVHPLVSEINIVDTGSTDNTIEIARRSGANVQTEQWANDYSRPRNTSLKMASADWILALDADETLDSDAIATIRAAVRKPGVAGYVLPTRNYMDDSSVANFVPNDRSCEPANAFKGWVESRKVRLFRRRPGIQFEGEIHEVIGPSIRRAGGKTELLDAVVHHFGFLASEVALKEKTEKMAALAEAKCISQNGNYQAHYELGVISAKLGGLEKAETCFRKAISLRHDFALAHYDLAVILARTGRNEEAVSEYRATIKLDPNNADALCNLAVCLQKLHCDRDAEETYRLLLEKHPRDMRGWNNLGALLASAGRMPEAEQAFENAVRIDPDFSLSLRNLESIRTLKTHGGASATNGKQSNTPVQQSDTPQCHSRESGNPFDSSELSNARFLPSVAGKDSPTLALIMIVKDEQDNLNELLPAISSCFDEIVIVDTGSKDKTVETAQTFTENVFHFAWSDDFSAARNFALSKAEADWVIWLDADDRIRPEDVSLMKAHISGASKAFLLRVVSSAGGSDTAEFIQLRLFPNIKGIEWEGRIHEQILPSMKRKGLDFELLAGATVFHTGYHDADMLRKKTVRNICLLKKEQEHRPDDSNVLHHLAQAYAIVGDIDKAIEISETLVHILREHPISEFLTSAINRLIQWSLFKGDIDTAHEWCKRLLTMDPQNRLLRFFIGEVHYRKELFDDAIDWFTQFCAAKETIGLTPVPWAALNANAHNYLGLAFKQTGRRENARAEWRTAIDLGAKVEAYKNLALMCLEEGNAPEAESALRAALERGYSDADIWNNLGVALARAHRFNEAADAFRNALCLDPPNAAMRENLERIEHKTRRQLSLNMIVRDEEKNLPEILAPIANLFDEIIIVDTGSRDNTVAMAEQFGARVIRHQWSDNFADARNAALNASTGKWIFWLDADDRIEPRAVRTLRKFIDRGIPCGVFFPLESIIGSSGEMVQNYSLRLFPNKPGISWRGAVHEQIADSLRSCGLELVNCPDFTIRHVGYEKEAEALKKNLRNLNLLAKELVANPEDPYVLFSLAQAFLFFGQEQHAVKWLQTLWKLRVPKDLSDNHVSPNPVDANLFAHEDSVGANSVGLNSVAHANSVGANLFVGANSVGANSFAHAGRKEDENIARDIYWMAAIILSDCAARSGSADEAEKWLERAIKLSPSNWVAYFLLGERKLHEGQTELAGDLLTKASEIGITLTLLPLDMNTIKEKLERYLAELKCAPACVRT